MLNCRTLKRLGTKATYDPGEMSAAGSGHGVCGAVTLFCSWTRDDACKMTDLRNAGHVLCRIIEAFNARSANKAGAACGARGRVVLGEVRHGGQIGLVAARCLLVLCRGAEARSATLPGRGGLQITNQTNNSCSSEKCI